MGCVLVSCHVAVCACVRVWEVYTCSAAACCSAAEANMDTFAIERACGGQVSLRARLGKHTAMTTMTSQHNCSSGLVEHKSRQAPWHGRSQTRLVFLKRNRCRFLRPSSRERAGEGNATRHVYRPSSSPSYCFVPLTVPPPIPPSVLPVPPSVPPVPVADGQRACLPGAGPAPAQADWTDPSYWYTCGTVGHHTDMYQVMCNRTKK